MKGPAVHVEEAVSKAYSEMLDDVDLEVDVAAREVLSLFGRREITGRSPPPVLVTLDIRIIHHRPVVCYYHCW